MKSLPRPFRKRVLSPFSPLSLALCSAAGLATEPPVTGADRVMPEIEIVASTPLPGLGQRRNEIAAPVQSATDRDLRNARALDLSEFMNRNLGSVFVNEIQGNSLQMDVNYRGFTASPLLGTPQGLSVYVDGVRLNQPFGDVVSWDLIPKNAIDTMTLIPGSNPLFGLNTLGGALSIQTKTGRSSPGTSVEAVAGSAGRRIFDVTHGGSNANGLDWFITGHLARDDGWRAESPTDARQFFGKLGWHDARTDVHLSFSHANNELNGNGLQEQRFLERDYSSVYTRPDTTRNRASSFNLQGMHALDPKTTLSGNLYYRKIDSSTLNADVNRDSLDQALYQPGATERAVLGAAGYTGFPASGETAANTPFPKWRCIAQGLLNDEPGEKCDGLLNRSSTSQRNYGVAAQSAFEGTLAGKRNQFTAGAAFDASRVDFRQSTQLGYLNPDRSVTGINSFADGISGGNVNGVPLDTRVDIFGKARTASIFATDTLSLADGLHLTFSGRYNHTRVATADHLHADGTPESLAGEHRFSRLNPAFGLAWSPTAGLATYLGYNEGSRTPSAIELGCANDAQPCKLPNAMAGDPPLRQVVTKTWEAGLRGRGAGNLRWNAGVFKAENHDDILFVSSQQSGFGYFKNFGQTRRQGIELGISDRIGQLSLAANLTLLDATFQSGETLGAAGNSSNDQAAAGISGVGGSIRVQSGDRMPLIPRRILKVNADYRLTQKWQVGANLLALSGAIARGNENNATQVSSPYYLGEGKTAGYALFNLGTTYAPTDRMELTIQVNNLFDRHYATAAQLGSTGFDGNGNFIARPFPEVNGQRGVANATFYAPGAPRQFWFGVKYAFDGPVRS